VLLFWVLSQIWGGFRIVHVFSQGVIVYHEHKEVSKERGYRGDVHVEVLMF